MVRRFGKKPVVIAAMQWNGPEDDAELAVFLGAWPNARNAAGQPCIKTLESDDGFHVVSAGDWVIRGVANEFYPCKPDIFAQTYDPE